MKDAKAEDERKARLAEALRANLRRRKDQAKKRQTGASGGDDAVNPPQSGRKRDG